MWCHFCEGTGKQDDGSECDVCEGTGYEPRPMYGCCGGLIYPEGKKAYFDYLKRALKHIGKEIKENEGI